MVFLLVESVVVLQNAGDDFAVELPSRSWWEKGEEVSTGYRVR